jgi:serine/threonine-protein kinase
LRAERRQRFLNEARAASALNHPHVCVVYDVGETEDGLPYIAMEFVEGQPASGRSTRNRWQLLVAVPTQWGLPTE